MTTADNSSVSPWAVEGGGEGVVSNLTSHPATRVSNSSATPRHHGAGHYAALVVMATVIVTALLGNVCNMAVIVRSSALRHSLSNFFVVSLCLCDLLAATLVVPAAALTFAVGEWPFGQVVCSVAGFSTSLFMFVSMTTLCVISVERYYSIRLPMHHAAHMTLTKTLTAVLTVWVWAALLAALPLVGVGSYDYRHHRYHCSFGWREGGAHRVYVGLVATLCFVVPGVILVAMYLGVFRVARQAATQVRPLPNTATRASITTTATTTTNNNNAALYSARVTSEADPFSPHSGQGPSGQCSITPAWSTGVRTVVTASERRPFNCPNDVHTLARISIRDSDDDVDNAGDVSYDGDVNSDGDVSNKSDINRDGDVHKASDVKTGGAVVYSVGVSGDDDSSVVKADVVMVQARSEQDGCKGTKTKGDVAGKGQTQHVQNGHASKSSLKQATPPKHGCYYGYAEDSGIASQGSEPHPHPLPAPSASSEAIVLRANTLRPVQGHLKAAKTLLMLLAAYAVLWGPFFIVHLHGAVRGDVHQPHTTELVALWLGFTSSAVNPFLYGWMNKAIREELVQLYRRVFCSCTCCSRGSQADLDDDLLQGPSNEDFLQFLERTSHAPPNPSPGTRPEVSELNIDSSDPF
ncbi:probable G-protein coupled receptor 101 [Littorina saxatilis]|uniref:G-protein coupled receptors family 1 profile domain-containing protein n=1 Tax=Littorina saxatilis TaxID=31220 RepID=A0AAN9GAM7_9CAEN